ncbi:MAG: hypothetical protein L3J04_06985 [Robiginitomaculum sp.]|nr:hypothetical protein [Robiginitomaculum sp.]
MELILQSGIPILGSVLVVTIGFLLNQSRERKAEWRKIKLELYRNYIFSLSGTLVGESTSKSQREYAIACNNLLLVAPSKVIDLMESHREKSHKDRTITLEDHDALLTKLLLAIRKDIGLSNKDNELFEVKLWSSGVLTSK